VIYGASLKVQKKLNLTKINYCYSTHKKHTSYISTHRKAPQPRSSFSFLTAWSTSHFCRGKKVKSQPANAGTRAYLHLKASIAFLPDNHYLSLGDEGEQQQQQRIVIETAGPIFSE
jgi:hypothetical protein